MNTALLTYHNAQLTPEARWFLMRWDTIIGLDQSIECSPQALFNRLGLTYGQGLRAWQVLTGKPSKKQRKQSAQRKKQEQFVDIEHLSSTGPGRPTSRYRLTTKLVKELAAIPPPSNNHHAEEITTLAKTTRVSTTDKEVDLIDSGRLRRTGLTLPNRWLLMVLLAHTDSPGIVTRLSLPTMQRLTGMSRSRITSQLKKLGDLGLIAHKQPGRYACKANARKTSIYLLDLAHPLMGNDDKEPVFIYPLPSKPDDKITQLIDGIIDAVMTAGICSLQIKTLFKKFNAIETTERDALNNSKKGSTPEGDPYHMAKFYQAEIDKIKNVKRYAEVLLLPITRYLTDGFEVLVQTYDATDADWLLTSVHADAMWMLSTAWTELKEGQLEPDEPNPEIMEGITRRIGPISEEVAQVDVDKEADGDTEASPNQAHKNEQSLSDTEATAANKKTPYPSLAILFYALSHHLAKQLQGAFELHGDIDFEAMNYMLVPRPDEQRPLLYQLYGYGLKAEDIRSGKEVVTFNYSTSEDLKTYWRAHLQDCQKTLSGGTDKPNT